MVDFNQQEQALYDASSFGQSGSIELGLLDSTVPSLTSFGTKCSLFGNSDGVHSLIFNPGSDHRLKLKQFLHDQRR
jgi:hypothetical protein